MKRVLAICMTCALLLGLCPAVWAEEEITGIIYDDTLITEDNVAELLADYTYDYDDATKTLEISGDFCILQKNLIISSGATLVVNTRLMLVGTITNDGTIRIAESAAMENYANVTNTGTITIEGEWNNSSMMQGQPMGTLSGSGTIDGLVFNALSSSEGTYVAYGNAVLKEEIEIGPERYDDSDVKLIISQGAVLTVPFEFCIDMWEYGVTSDNLTEYLKIDGQLVVEGELFLPEGVTTEDIAELNIICRGDGEIIATDQDDVSSSYYSVTFTDGVPSQWVVKKGTVTKPEDPSKDGYTFNGWYNGDTEWSFETGKVTTNITLTANWTKNAPPPHSHSWAAEWTTDGTHHWHECTAEGCGITSDSDKDGYGAHVYDNDSDTTCNVCGYVRTVTLPTCQVTVIGGTGGGDYQAGETVTVTATVPSGKRFTGWTVNEGGVTLANSATATFTMPGENVTVTANFQSTSSSSGSSGSGGSSSGGGSSASYPPTVVQPSEGGGVTVSTSRPQKGDKVTVTPRPDQGYEVDKITVTDQNGKPVEVRANSDGTYSFVQPSGKVKIEISYKAPVETEWHSPFTDISKNEWYYDAARYVQENGLMDGYVSGAFGPNDILSRAMLAQILYNKEGRPAVSGSAFTDVDSGAWCADAITWAAAQGIVGGYGNGMFGPNDNITREQLAVMLWRYAGSPAAAEKELRFTDTDEISGYALNALRWAVENGVLNGYGDGRLGPKGLATRAQVAQILMNFLKNQ